MTKKEMRQLNDDEKKFAQKTVDGRKAELKHLKLMVKYNEFMTDGGMLESNYLEKVRAFKRQTDDYKNEIADIERIIDITSKQIKEGVEVKIDEENITTPEMVK